MPNLIDTLASAFQNVKNTVSDFISNPIQRLTQQSPTPPDQFQNISLPVIEHTIINPSIIAGIAAQTVAAPSTLLMDAGIFAASNPKTALALASSVIASTKDPNVINDVAQAPSEFVQASLDAGTLLKNPSIEGVAEFVKKHPLYTSLIAGSAIYGLYQLSKTTNILKPDTPSPVTEAVPPSPASPQNITIVNQIPSPVVTPKKHLKRRKSSKHYVKRRPSRHSR